MPTTPRLRRMAAVPAAALVATTLAAVGPAASPAAADPGCLTEQPQGTFVRTICDDSLPPTVDSLVMKPAPFDERGWTSSDQVTFTFTGGFTDADPDTLGFQCTFSTNPQDASWKACGTYDDAAKTWVQSYDELEETAAVPYVFKVRAIDLGDHARDATQGCFLCTPADADLADFSASRSVSFSVDTGVPVGSLWARDNLYDEVTPEWPMLRSRNLRVTRTAGASNDASPVAFYCKLDGAPLRCPDRDFQLSRLTPGDHVLTALATDAAGNVDPTAARLQFSVPKNLRAKKGSAWKRLRLGGHFSGDYLETRRKGATVSINVRNAKDVRLIAPRGPLLGKVQVRIARMPWKTINLAGDETEKFHVYQVRDPFQAPISGRLQVRAKKVGKNKPVRIDAVLAH